MSADARTSGSGAPAQATIVSVVSPASGTGRTSAVVNVAWILASAGKKVLIVDLDAQRPSARGYLRPFHVESRSAEDINRGTSASELEARAAARLGLRRLALAGLDPSLTVRRYRLAGGGVGIDLVEIPDLPLAGQEREADLDTTTGVVELKAALQALRYDYVLVDHPTDASDLAMTRVALLSDVVAVCFRLLPPMSPKPTASRRGSAAGRGTRSESSRWPPRSRSRADGARTAP
jgi:cellulose biosynthesis protein BcsQ